jgi:hypothetical protein
MEIILTTPYFLLHKLFSDYMSLLCGLWHGPNRISWWLLAGLCSNIAKDIRAATGERGWLVFRARPSQIHERRAGSVRPHLGTKTYIPGWDTPAGEIPAPFIPGARSPCLGSGAPLLFGGQTIYPRPGI